MRSLPLVALALVACSGADPSPLLDQDAATTTDGSQPDVAVDALPPTSACDAGGACSAPDVPSGWAPVAFTTNASTPCAKDYGTADDVLADPTVSSNACSCSCTKTQDPDCETGTSSWSGVGSSCTGFNPYPISFSGGKCHVIGGTVDDYDKATTIAPSGGACTVASVADNGAIGGKKARICAADATCAAATCGGYAPAGFDACIISDGDVACPASSAFSAKHMVSKNPTVQCSDCGTGCTFQGSCTNPQLSFYSNQTCTALIVSIPADGTCDATGHANAVIGGMIYSATPSFTGCAATGTSTATIQATDARKVCCRP